MSAQVLKGDCLELLARCEDSSVNLVYADPPFFTGKTHRLRPRDRSREFSFDDLWSSHQHYAEFLHARVQHMHRVLKDDGVVFIHCDRNSTHIVRGILDVVFSEENFRSEIIWHYRRWSNSRKGLLPAHQTIYFYSKSTDFTFNRIFEEYSPSTNVDQILQRRKRDDYGKAIYDRDVNGDTLSAGPKRGVPLSDVWDIPYLNPKARERTGYPTQKPILLLDRIIRLCTQVNDIVLDPFCGSGTTLLAASILHRHSIGMDISEDAVQLTQSRLKAPTVTKSRLMELGRESYRQANSELLALLYGLKFHPVHRNAGIDALLQHDPISEPIPVRIQRPEESLYEAASRLLKAVESKNSGLNILLATHRNHQPLFDCIPDSVVVVDAPALLISGILETPIDSGT